MYSNRNIPIIYYFVNNSNINLIELMTKDKIMYAHNTFICYENNNNVFFVFISFSRKQVKSFAFDHCFNSSDPGDIQFAGQEQVFQCLGHDILDNAFQGYNACIFAYGQTGK